MITPEIFGVRDEILGFRKKPDQSQNTDTQVAEPAAQDTEQTSSEPAPGFFGYLRGRGRKNSEPTGKHIPRVVTPAPQANPMASAAPAPEVLPAARPTVAMARRPSDLEQIAQILNQVIGMTAATAALSDELKARLYGECGITESHHDIPNTGAMIPRLIAQAEQICRNAGRASVNLTDVSHVA